MGRTTKTGVHRMVRCALLSVALLALSGIFFAATAGAANPKALILGSTVSPGRATDGSGLSLEEQQAQLAGFDTTVVDDATWDAMTASQFAAYQVLIIGDPTCGDTTSPGTAAANNASVWQSVVMSSGGNKVIIGTDPTYHNNGPGGSQRGDLLEKNGIAFAGARAGATGAYVDISCDSVYTDTSVPYAFLDGLTSHAPGSFQTQMAPCEGNISIVAQSGPTSGLHDVDLANWGCSVHQSFLTWPSDYTPLALATDAPSQPYCANDVDTGALACGEPYILVSGGGVVITSNITLTPATATNPVGTDHTVTATVKDSTGAALSGKTVTFTVESGPNVGATGTAVTNGAGQATFTYHDSGGAGTDSISAVFTTDAGAQQKATAEKIWVASTGDTTPPTCVLSGMVAGPPKQLQITISDSGSGLGSIVVTESTNADTPVPPFATGSTSPVLVTATKIDQSKGSNVAITVTDVAGNVTKCDPYWPGAKPHKAAPHKRTVLRLSPFGWLARLLS